MLIAAGYAAPCGSSSDAGDYCVFKVTGLSFLRVELRFTTFWAFLSLVAALSLPLVNHRLPHQTSTKWGRLAFSDEF